MGVWIGITLGVISNKLLFSNPVSTWEIALLISAMSGLTIILDRKFMKRPF